jgi:hypothetical protein
VSDLEKIAQLCVRLGAETGQAATMAAQLVKRADQIANERSIPREEALTQLLQILVQGRQGEVPAAFKTPGHPGSEQ